MSQETRGSTPPIQNGCPLPVSRCSFHCTAPSSISWLALASRFAIRTPSSQRMHSKAQASRVPNASQAGQWHNCPSSAMKTAATVKCVLECAQSNLKIPKFRFSATSRHVVSLVVCLLGLGLWHTRYREVGYLRWV